MVTKSVFHSGPCDAHVAVFSLQFIYFFSTRVLLGKTGVFDVPESLDAMQTNLVVSNRLDPADLGSKARAI